MIASTLKTAPYDRIAADFDRHRRTMSLKELVMFELAIDGLNPGDVVLDLGCGTCRPFGVELRFRGIGVHGVDESSDMLHRAKVNVPTATLVQSTVEDFETDRRFGAVIFWDVLFHIPAERHLDVLRHVSKWLSEEGRLMLSSGGIVESKGGFHDTMFGHEFFYDSLPPEVLIDQLAECNLFPMIHSMIDEPDGGRNRGRFAGVFQKLGP